MNIDAVIAQLAPGWALKRAKARAMMRVYDAAGTSNYHKSIKNGGFSGDAVMELTGSKLRAWARYLDENHDLAIGILDTLVNNIVGPGLIIEPMVSTKSGVLHDRINNELRELWVEFWKRPEVTRELPGNEVERILCRSWLRDGEVLTHHVMGTDALIRHPTDIPYSLELLEADYLPFSMLRNDEGIIHGVEKNTWGQPIAYHLYLEHPGDTSRPFSSVSTKTKRVAARDMTHLKFIKRIRQTRGVPVLHGIIQRLADIKDYEESERIAARIAASWTGFITRSIDMAQNLDAASGERTMEMQAGMIFDNLLPGEKPEIIGSGRPNTGLQDFRDAMMRACAGGTGTNYSSISKNYNGTYSAQRQEMVESQPAYDRMRKYFISVQMQPIWERFVTFATQSLVRIPSNINLQTLMQADIRGTGLPWIDPKKEVEADRLSVEAGFESRPGIIRKRGGNPKMVDKEREADTMAPEMDNDNTPSSEQDQEQQEAAA